MIMSEKIRKLEQLVRIKDTKIDSPAGLAEASRQRGAEPEGKPRASSADLAAGSRTRGLTAKLEQR